jgi:hypothetical protein
MIIKDFKNRLSNSVYLRKIQYTIDFQIFKAKNIVDIYAIAYIDTLGSIKTKPNKLYNQLKKIIHQTVVPHCRKPTAHSSTFGFCQRITQTKNQKSLNFANARQKLK